MLKTDWAYNGLETFNTKDDRGDEMWKKKRKWQI